MPTTKITSFASLKTVVASWLNRRDVDDEIGNFIQNAEARLRRDRRVRNLKRVVFTITQDGEAVPSGFDSLDSWTYQGPTAFGSIEMVDPGDFGAMKSRHGPAGPPSFAARVGDEFFFAPAPDGEYSTVMTYWEDLTPLEDGTNWLVEEHPDIYLYATLVESAPFLKDDSRLGVWESILGSRLFDLGVEVEDDRFGGPLTRRPGTVIGG